MVRWFTAIFAYTADFGRHKEITLQGDLHRDYTLRLSIENEELELQTQDDRTWTPVRRPYVPCFSLHNPPDSCVCVEVFLRHPTCAQRFN